MSLKEELLGGPHSVHCFPLNHRRTRHGRAAVKSGAIE
jgi:hypothetical protein